MTLVDKIVLWILVAIVLAMALVVLVGCTCADPVPPTVAPQTPADSASSGLSHVAKWGVYLTGGGIVALIAAILLFRGGVVYAVVLALAGAALTAFGVAGEGAIRGLARMGVLVAWLLPIALCGVLLVTLLRVIRSWEVGKATEAMRAIWEEIKAKVRKSQGWLVTHIVGMFR